MPASHFVGLEGKRQDNSHKYLGIFAVLVFGFVFFFPFPKCIHNISLFLIYV